MLTATSSGERHALLGRELLACLAKVSRRPAGCLAQSSHGLDAVTARGTIRAPRSTCAGALRRHPGRCARDLWAFGCVSTDARRAAGRDGETAASIIGASSAPNRRAAVGASGAPWRSTASSAAACKKSEAAVRTSARAARTRDRARRYRDSVAPSRSFTAGWDGFAAHSGRSSSWSRDPGDELRRDAPAPPFVSTSPWRRRRIHAHDDPRISPSSPRRHPHRRRRAGRIAAGSLCLRSLEVLGPAPSRHGRRRGPVLFAHSPRIVFFSGEPN